MKLKILFFVFLLVCMFLCFGQEGYYQFEF